MVPTRVKPEEELTLYKERVVDVTGPEPSYGVDFPAGLISSTIFAPLYLYASLRGKFDFWKALLERVPLQDGNPATDLSLPTLDAGCGRGLVLVQTAEIRAPVARNRGSHKHLAQSVGIDLFITADQTGNSANVTCKNLLAEGVGYVTELYKASFLELPFEDDTFVHNPARSTPRCKAIEELGRVLKPGSTLLILDLGD